MKKEYNGTIIKYSKIFVINVLIEKQILHNYINVMFMKKNNKKKNVNFRFKQCNKYLEKLIINF